MVKTPLKIIAPAKENKAIRHIGILVFDGVVLADVVTTLDVFGVGDKLVSSIFPGVAGYAISLLSLNGGMVTSSASVQIMTLPLPPHDNHTFDTLVIVSGTGNFDAYRNPDLLEWLQKISGNIRRIAAICTGVFVMGAAGLLDHRRATTHWALQDRLLREFPHIKVEREALITEDEGIFTTSDVGIAADLALRLLESDLGSAVAKRVAESLVACQRRDNPHPIRAVKTEKSDPVIAKSNKIQQASRWFVEHMGEPINMISAANSVSMSERNFLRQFKRETGQTPHQFLLHLRLEAVRRQLTETDLPVDKIARRCGLLSGEHAAKLFRKHMSMSPGEYRKREQGQNHHDRTVKIEMMAPPGASGAAGISAPAPCTG